jgi:tRNA threonylcarbamoyl adenosine modification protein (Sua5/YciO/YrdC/YwlC family)
MTTVASSSAAAMDAAAQSLRDGLLVAFPTETVYGLGAHALDGAAAKRIFEVKGRPPTDPLIVHITDPETMATLWDIDSASLAVCRGLAAKFWPGPLTIVARAAAVVPDVVCGGSGFVGLRVPNHPVALDLLTRAGVPVAAPSANTFGHVSPTTAAHVDADLASRDATLTIVDGGQSSVGIESTVVKVVSSTHIEVLRRGHVSADDIVQALAALHIECDVTLRDTRTRAAVPNMPMDGPGQLLTHYSPRLPTYLVTPDTATAALDSKQPWAAVDADGVELAPAGEVIVLDFGGALAALQATALAYRSLSATGSDDEACHDVFDALRWTETIAEGTVVVLPMVTAWSSGSPSSLLEAVEDRLFRAASGRVATLAPR